MRWAVGAVLCWALAIGCGGDDGSSDAQVPDAGMDGAADGAVDSASDGLVDSAPDVLVDAPPDVPRDVGTRPPLSYELGSCDALLAPFPLETDAQRAEAVAIVEVLDPVRRFGTVGWDGFDGTLWDGADDCVTTTSGLSTRHRVDAEDGCASTNGADYWGQLTTFGSLRTFELTAVAFSYAAAPGDVELVQLDGTARRTWSGYMVGNPPFLASAALYLHVVASPSVDAPHGAYYLVLDKDGYYEAATGYVHAIDTNGGAVGDFCFRTTYDGGILGTVEVRSDGIGY